MEKNLLVWLSHAFDVNNGDDSDDESDNERGEDEEITHFIGSKNIGAAHEKKTTTKIFGTSMRCSLGRQDSASLY